MKRNMLRTAALCCAVLLALCLAACGSSGGEAPQSGGSAAQKNYSIQEEVSEDSAPRASDGSVGAASGEFGGTAGAQAMKPQDGRRIILTANLTVEALDFDATCAALLARLEEVGGYVSSSDVYTPSFEGASRSAHYQLRVPVARYDAFMQGVSEAGHVVSKNESGEDVTAEYVDVDARLKSLRLQEERLFEMMEQAGELETLLAVQNQLTEVQYQIEGYTSRQRTLDDLIACCTVNLDVEEVRQITEKPETFADRVSKSFRRGWSRFGGDVQDFVVWFVGSLPTLLVLAVLAALCVLFVRRMQKRAARLRAERGPVKPAEYAAPAKTQEDAKPDGEATGPKYR